MEANATIDQIVPHLTTSAKKLLKFHEVANIGARNQHKVGNTNHQINENSNNGMIRNSSAQASCAKV